MGTFQPKNTLPGRSPSWPIPRIWFGDFNIPSVDKKDKLFKAITSKGLRIPAGIVNIRGTNLSGKNRYDQILHYPRESVSFSATGGVLDIYDGNYRKLYPRTRLTDKKLTWELSDHLPLWIQINTDTEDEELDQLLG